VDVWASGGRGRLGFAAARLFDTFDPVEREEKFLPSGDYGGTGTDEAVQGAREGCLEYQR
jgi:hypothetical protein